MAEEEKPEPVYRKIWVKAAPPADPTMPNTCGVWDKHPQQEGGEAFVAGSAVKQVAATPVVLDALAKGRIVEVSGPAAREKPEGIEPGPPSEGSPALPAIGGQAPADVAEKRRK